MYCICCFFFFNDTATTEIYTLSLHDALPIWSTKASTTFERFSKVYAKAVGGGKLLKPNPGKSGAMTDRKSTRLNSSHANISYAVFCLKKKKKKLTYLHSNPTIKRQHILPLYH